MNKPKTPSLDQMRLELMGGGGQPKHHYLLAAKGGAVNDSAFIGYLSPDGKFESYPESVARANDYHHSHTIKDLDAYDKEGGLTFVRMGGEPILSIKGTPAIDPFHHKSSPMISDLARRVIKAGAHPDMPIKIEHMGYAKHEAPYQEKHIGTLHEWSMRNSPVKKAKGGIVSLLRKHGRPVDSDLDAMRKMSNGHRVFIAHEQDEKPREITSVSEMHGYTPDQIYTVDPQHFAQHKAKGGKANLSEMRAYLLQNKGTEGTRRLERATDEVPNLENMYSTDALKNAFAGDNAKAIATINPKDFERYAMPLPMNLATGKSYFRSEAKNPTMREAFMDSGLTDQQWQELNDYQRADLFDKYDAKISKMAVNRPMSYDQYIKHLAKIKGGFSDVPFLELNKQEQGLPLTPFISGHEGRHRNRALSAKGVEKSLVQLIPRAELREPFPRRSNDEYLDALRKEMAMTNNMVRPEDEDKYGNGQITTVKRPPIQLPDFYADGGTISQDAMQLALMPKVQSYPKTVTHAHQLEIEERPL